MAIRVRPTSIDSVTGTSRMTSRLTSRAGSSDVCGATAASDLAFMSIPLAGSAQQRRVHGVVARTADALLVTNTLLAARHAERAAEQRHALGEHRGLAAEVAGHHVAGLQRNQLRQGDAAAAQHGGQLDLGVLHAFLE